MLKQNAIKTRDKIVLVSLSRDIFEEEQRNDCLLRTIKNIKNVF